MAAQIQERLFSLNDGYEIPAVALGTFQDSFSNTDQEDAIQIAVKTAIENGYQHLDTAAAYDTETSIGKAVKEKIDEGVIKRSDIYLTTKLWVTCNRREYVVPSLKKSLKNLQMEYVDLYLIHWPVALKHSDEIIPRDGDGSVLFDEDVDFLDTWKGMEECKKLGLTKSIGVSNFNRQQVERLLANCEIPPAVNQMDLLPADITRVIVRLVTMTEDLIECHVYNTCVDLTNYCKQKEIVVMCSTPLGRPGGSTRKDGDPDLFTDKTLTSISKTHGKSNAQMALRYLLQCGYVVVPKSNNKLRQKENLEILNFSLSEAEMETIAACNKDHRVIWFDVLKGSKEYPFTEIKTANF